MHIKIAAMISIIACLATPAFSQKLLMYTAREAQEVRVLSDRYICVVWDSTDAVQAQRQRLYGGLSEYTDATYWKRIMLLKFQTMAIWKQTRPTMLKQLVDPASWLVNGKRPEGCSLWTQSVDAYPDPLKGAKSLPLPRMVEYVYLRLPELRGQTHLDITAPNKQRLSADIGTLQSSCWSIKVNQVGYLPDAQKLAYFGMWLGEGGAMPVDHLVGKPFEIVSEKSHQPVYRGIIALRARNVDVKRGGQPLTGEDLCVLDFSKLIQPGEYAVFIPGVGKSWPFRIGNDVYGLPFYTSMRGLYHQRCGVALDPQFTQWSRKACHTETYQAKFIPEGNRYYENPNGVTVDGKLYGFTDEQGKAVAVNPFTMVYSTATDKLVPGLKGGWHDAADFDRRFWHYEAVWDLCGAYEMYPRKFRDGQLQIPESENGIPDILDEAMVGIDVWAKTQTPEGGVAGWIEQTSHPLNTGTADIDKGRFYCAMPDRASSYAFAAAASQMSRLLMPFDAKKAKLYLQQARKAYTWASDDDNRITMQFKVPEGSRQPNLTGKTIKFEEPAKIQGMGPIFRLMASLQLAATTGEGSYLQRFRDEGGAQQMVQWLPDEIPHFAFVTALCSDLLTSAEKQLIQTAVLKEADLFVEGSRSLPYHNLWRPIDHPYFQNMGWGMGSSAYRARLQILAYRVTGQPKYREAALNGANWELGANELGRSLETGLGSVFPVVLQHIDSECDGIDEPVPGISPFTLTYGMSASSWWYQYSLMEKAHPDSTTFYDETPMVVLPALSAKTDINKRLAALPRVGNWMWDAVALVRPLIEPMYPIMRRMFIHPSLEPAQNEFTSWESIAPHAAVYGCLMQDGWLPAKELSTRKPRTKAQMVYYPQP